MGRQRQCDVIHALIWIYLSMLSHTASLFISIHFDRWYKVIAERVWTNANSFRRHISETLSTCYNTLTQISRFHLQTQKIVKIYLFILFLLASVVRGMKKSKFLSLSLSVYLPIKYIETEEGEGGRRGVKTEEISMKRIACRQFLSMNNVFWFGTLEMASNSNNSDSSIYRFSFVCSFRGYIQAMRWLSNNNNRSSSSRP